MPPSGFHQCGHWGRSGNAEQEELDSTHSSYLIITFIGLFILRSTGKKYFYLMEIFRGGELCKCIAVFCTDYLERLHLIEE